MKKFVIIGHPRSGSTYLCSLLESHRKIVCHYEVFNPREIGTHRGFHDPSGRMRGFTPQTRDDHPAAFLRTLWRSSPGAAAVGFKIFVGQSPRAHEVVLRDREILKVLLRRNPVDSYVSVLIAERTGAFTSEQAVAATPFARVHLDARGLLGFAREIRRYFSYVERVLQETGQSCLRVRYEDLIQGQKALQSVLAFIGIEGGEDSLSAFTAKQNPSALEEKAHDLAATVSGLVEEYFEKESQVETYERVLAEHQRQIAELQGLTERLLRKQAGKS